MLLSEGLRRTIPVCFLPSGSLVCYSKGSFLFFKNGIKYRSIKLEMSCAEKIKSSNNLFSRFFRVGVRAAEGLDEQSLIFSQGNMIYELNIETEKVSRGFFCGHGIRPLSFTSVIGINNINDGVYFGGYLDNPQKKSVNIYKRIGPDEWIVVYTFPQGSINHVHNIIPDRYRQCLWIFTGDFDDSAAIWKASDDFHNVVRVASNDQKFRSCVAFALPEGLLYATDTPFDQNHLFLMNTDNGNLEVLRDIDGSCIYGCKWNNDYVFSSTVEPDGRNTNILKVLTSRKRGGGIKDDFVHMYCGNLDTGFLEIYKEKKDSFPYAAFQFGTFKFPYGENLTDTLYFQPIATVENDLKMLKYKK